MKHLIIITTVLVYSVITQKHYNFKALNSQLQWSKVFENSTTIENYNLYLKKQGAESYIENNLLNFTIHFTADKLKKYGYTKGNYPSYLKAGGAVHGFIELKEGRNKVTITNINLIDIINPEASENLDVYIIKNNTIKTSKNTTKVLNLFDKYLLDTFSNPVNDDW